MIKCVLCHRENNIIVREEKNGKVQYEKLNSDDMQEYISTMCLNFRESVIFWVQDLRLYAESIITLLYFMGWEDVTAENTSVKKMPSQSFKYAVEIRGNAYYIFMRAGRHTIYMYNADNLLGNISEFEILRDFGDGGATLEKLSDATYKAILKLSGFQEKRTPFTISMLAMREWKKIEDLRGCKNLINCKNFYSPDETELLSVYLRKSYCGGWNYLNDRISQSVYRKQPGKVYDVNSLYPYIMATKPLPWRDPIPFKGGTIPHKDDPAYYYYVRVKLKFELKDDSFPYIQKRGDFRYRFMDYLKTSDIITIDQNGQEHRTSKIRNLNGEVEDVFPEFVLTKTDYELIHRHYNILKEEIIDGVCFKTARCIFKHYVNLFYDKKEKADKEGATGEKRIAKMLLNGLSGTLAKREKRVNLVYKEVDGHLETEPVTTLSQSESYIHMASAILSYAREYTYEAACANREHFLYADTDSLHIFGENYEPVGIEIDNSALGKWKIEKEFVDACYMKRKCYTLKTTNNDYKLTMAGIPFGFKEYIEDVLNGKTESDIYEKAYYGDYKDASEIIKKGYEFKFSDYDEDEELENDYTGNLQNSFKDFQNECKEYDPCTILQYVKYPSGITVCENFKLSHRLLWEYMQPIHNYG